MTISSLRTILLGSFALSLVCPLASAGEIFNEDFSTGYERGKLVGQNGWAETVDPSSPAVFDTEGRYGRDGWAVTASRKASSNDFALKAITNPKLESDSRIVVEIIASRATEGDAGCGVAFGFGAKEMDKVIGISQRNAYFRDGWGGEQSAIATDGSDWNDFGTEDIVVLRSVWDLGTGTATLEMKNLSADETDFTPLYFDEAQTQTTIDIGDMSGIASWDKVFIRITGTKQARLYSATITVE